MAAIREANPDLFAQLLTHQIEMWVAEAAARAEEARAS
jgi:hypothetical protein